MRFGLANDGAHASASLFMARRHVRHLPLRPGRGVLARGWQGPPPG